MNKIDLKTNTWNIWLIYINKNVTVCLYLWLISESSSSIALKFWHNVAFNYAHVFIYLLYKNFTPVTGKASLKCSHLLDVSISKLECHFVLIISWHKVQWRTWRVVQTTSRYTILQKTAEMTLRVLCDSR